MLGAASLAALAAELLRDIADQKAIGVERLVELVWVVLTRDELGRMARAVLDAPREHALRRGVELAAAVLGVKRQLVANTATTDASVAGSNDDGR